MSAALAEALRLLGLPLDVTFGEGELTDAYREAARSHHPDGAPVDELAERTERMRAINVARDMVRTHLDRLATEPFDAFGNPEGPESSAWWEGLVDNPESLGIRVRPGRRPHVSWADRFDAARLALGIAVGDVVTIDQDGVLVVGTVTAFDSSVRVGQRISLGGMPVELRRVGVEVRLPDDSIKTFDAALVQAAGWRCPVCLRTSPHGLPRTRPCPRCLRRFRAGYDRWRDLGADRRRYQRRLERLQARPAAFTPRRYPRYRELEDAVAAARQTVTSLQATEAGLVAALEAAEQARAEASLRAGRARSASGIERRERDEKAHAAAARRARSALAAVRVALEAATSEVADVVGALERLERELGSRHAAERAAWRSGAARRRREREEADAALRRVEIELRSLNPDALPLLDGFEAWDQPPDRWLGDSKSA